MGSSEVRPGSLEDRDITRFDDQEHPGLSEAISAFLSDYDGPDEDIYRVELGVLASREVTYKVYRKEYEEPLSGVISV